MYLQIIHTNKRMGKHCPGATVAFEELTTQTLKRHFKMSSPNFMLILPTGNIIN